MGMDRMHADSYISESRGWQAGHNLGKAMPGSAIAVTRFEHPGPSIRYVPKTKIFQFHPSPVNNELIRPRHQRVRPARQP